MKCDVIFNSHDATVSITSKHMPCHMPMDHQHRRKKTWTELNIMSTISDQMSWSYLSNQDRRISLQAKVATAAAARRGAGAGQEDGGRTKEEQGRKASVDFILIAINCCVYTFNLFLSWYQLLLVVGHVRMTFAFGGTFA